MWGGGGFSFRVGQENRVSPSHPVTLQEDDLTFLLTFDPQSSTRKRSLPADWTWKGRAESNDPPPA